MDDFPKVALIVGSLTWPIAYLLFRREAGAGRKAGAQESWAELEQLPENVPRTAYHKFCVWRGEYYDTAPLFGAFWGLALYGLCWGWVPLILDAAFGVSEDHYTQLLAAWSPYVMMLVFAVVFFPRQYFAYHPLARDRWSTSFFNERIFVTDLLGGVVLIIVMSALLHVQRMGT